MKHSARTVTQRTLALTGFQLYGYSLGTMQYLRNPANRRVPQALRWLTQYVNTIWTGLFESPPSKPMLKT